MLDGFAVGAMVGVVDLSDIFAPASRRGAVVEVCIGGSFSFSVSETATAPSENRIKHEIM